MGISDNRYVTLTTFTRDGRRKACPVWVVSLGERDVGFTTETASWKAKRISHTPNVELVACNFRGVTIDGSESISGVARLVYDDEFQEVQDAIRAKYGFQAFFLIVFMEKVRKLFGLSGPASCGVVITVTP